MSLRSKILASACVLAVGAFAVPAGATNFDGVFSGDYSHLDANGGGSANSWGASGSGAFGLGGDWAGEIDGGYHNLNGSGTNVDLWDVDGSVMWRTMQGRAGLVVGYDDASGGGVSINATNYGAFGEWYASPHFTVGAKGGWFNANHGVDGDYVGAAVTGYIMPNLSLSGGYDYTHLNHFGNENDWSVTGEWMFSQTMPVSVYAGYTNTKISGGGPTIDTWTVGIKLYTDPMPGSMEDRQRSGAATWGTSWRPLALSL
ncbi:MAG TPA: hypothetical protein VMH86_13845 [Rhizomicrobium sp.]|nr:hypothetical protein [Rhizomicrobium sp.]